MSDTLPLPPMPALPKPDGPIYGPDRKVRGHAMLPPKVHAYAIGYGQLCADVTQAAAEQRIAALRAGNTALLEALMNVLAQQPDNYGEAMRVLAAAGMVDAAGEFDWAALEARKEPTRANLQPLLHRAEAAQHDFVEDYVLDDGEHEPHHPSEFESLLIFDAISGLLADEAWQDAYHDWDVARRAQRPQPTTTKEPQ